MANEQSKGAGPPVTLKERFNVFPGSPLPELDSPTAQAFHAEDMREEGRPVFALIVRPGVIPRMNVLRVAKGMESPGIMLMHEWGVIDWSPSGRKVMAIIYDRPYGPRVMADLTGEIKRFGDEDLIKKVVTPIVSALTKLAGHSLTHRAIRPSNLFWATQEHDRVVLGDFATAPPAYAQPALLETIESGMSHPAARGNGSALDDLYSLGATLAALLIGKIPRIAVEDYETIRSKILHGSYSVLVGEERMPMPMMEMLRGLLSDDPRERWSRESLEQWVGGRRLPPLPIKLEKRPARAFTFNGKEYQSSRELAMAMVRNWDDVAPYILDGRLELWLRRALDFKDKANAIGASVQNAGFAVGEKRIAHDVLVARALTVLDSAAPVRYKTLAFMPEGFGNLLGMTLGQGGDPKLLLEALVREVPRQWLETRENYTPELGGAEGKLRQVKSYYERANIGYGLERVIYEICEGMPCQSPFTIDDYVLELRDLLPALSAHSKKAAGKSWPVDRHVAAFIAVNATFDVERQLGEIAEPGLERSTLGLLNLLALIQWRLGQTGLFGLVSWVGGLMQPAISSYHNRQKRRELEREVPRVVRQGSMVDLSRLLDNPEDRALDQMGFETARGDWMQAASQIKDIEQGKESIDETILNTSQQVAALISVSIALLTVVVLAITRLL